MTVWTVVILIGLSSASSAQAESPSVVEGDILTRASDSAARDGSIRRAVHYPRHRLWPDGVMPLWIDPAIGAAAAAEVRAAIAIWNRQAGIRVEEWTSAPHNAAGEPLDHVQVIPGDVCASWVGRRSGAQALWVAPACGRGTILHELGHSLGLEHEHTRTDRDAWIRIVWDNVQPDKRHNFDMAPSDARLLGEYDYNSLMHYGVDFFGIDGAPTIEPLDPDAIIGQRLAPSEGDLAAIQTLYGTDLALSADLHENEVPGRVSLQASVTNQGGAGAHGVRLRANLPPGWRVERPAEDAAGATADWACSAQNATLDCELDRLSRDAVARLSLQLSVPVEAGEGPQLAFVQLYAGTDDTRADNDTVALRRVISKDGTSTYVDEPDALSSANSVRLPPNGLDDDRLPATATSAERDDGVGAGGSGGLGAAGAGWLLLAGLALLRRRPRRPGSLGSSVRAVPGTVTAG